MYNARTIKQEMGHDRNELIKMALFMGSDYTKGVKGIAQVNAIEIITSFPDIEIQNNEVKEKEFGSGLHRFKTWVENRYIEQPLKRNKRLEAI